MIKEFNNFFEMLSNIEDHIKKHGRYIIVDDNPIKFLIGFSCSKTKESFVIKIPHLNIDNIQENLKYYESDLLLKIIPLISKRNELTIYLNNGPLQKTLGSLAAFT